MFCSGGDNIRMRKWFQNDELVPTNRYLREEDFFFYEMHCGGCGGYITATMGNQYGVKAATVGLGFGKLIIRFHIPMMC